MTYDELIHHFNSIFGNNGPWPLTYEVDLETYANVCDGIFQRKLRSKVGKIDFEGYTLDNTAFLDIGVGPHAGIKLRNIELIIKR